MQKALEAQNTGGDLDSVSLGDVDLRNYLRYQIPEKLEFTVNFSGAQVSEIAISLAANIEAIETLSLGINIKSAKIEIIEFAQPVEDVNYEDYTLPQNRRSHRRLNIDIGATYHVDKHLTVAGVVRNLIPYTLASPSGSSVKFMPLARVGLNYRRDNISLIMDFDLTTNEPLGFDPDKRYLSVGVEWFPWNPLALRAGYRYNTVDGSGLPSLGLGLGYRQGHIDFAVTRSNINDEYGISLQAGFQF